MKKLILIIIMIFIMIPNIKAEELKLEFNGSDTVNVDYNTNIYLKVDSQTSFNKIDISYNTSNNIKIISLIPMSSMKEVSKTNSRIILTSDKLIPSGSTVLAFSIKGIKEGNSSLNINSIKITNDQGKIISGNKSSYNLTINSLKNTEELLDEANINALSKATLLVEASEKSELEDDYKAALDSVESLIDSDDKTNLLKRLSEVKYKITIKSECEVKSEDKKDEESSKPIISNSWILLSAGLMLVIVIETICLIVIKARENKI